MSKYQSTPHSTFNLAYHCRECMEFTGPANIPEHLHYPGAMYK